MSIIERKLALAVKEWLFDRYAGFNNDDEHSWKFADLILEFEKENGVVSLKHLLDIGHGGDLEKRTWKEFLKAFPQSEA